MKGRLYLPMWMLNIYIFIGVAISIAGPLEYYEYNYLPIIVYMMMISFSFSIGYRSAIVAPIRVKRYLSAHSMRTYTSRLFSLSGWVSATITSFLIVHTMTTTGLNLNILNAGQAYVGAYDNYVRNTGSYSAVFLISSVAAPFVFITSVLGAYYYRTLSRRQKYFFLYTVIGTLLIFTIGGGKQKQFGDFLIYFLTIYAIIRAQKNTLTFGFLLKAFAILFLGILVMLVLLSSRYAAVEINSINLNRVIHPLIRFNEDHPIIIVLGAKIGFPITMLSGYFGQGYYGLSLSLEQPFTWTGFAGGSYSVSVILNQFFGLPSMVEHNYPYLVADRTGWDQTKWHTVFAWLASDIGYTGCVVLAGLIGYLYGGAWKEAVLVRNPFSVMVFCLLSVGAAYMPANNQLMHSPGALFTLLFVLYLYVKYRGTTNYHALFPRTGMVAENNKANMAR